jgi:hypothetical protein
MPRVDIDGADFPTAHAVLNDTWESEWHLPQLVRAAALVGRLPFDAMAYGQWSAIELFSRAALVWANLRVAGDRFVQSGVYQTADPSEKRIASYYLGQTLAYLFAGRYLGTPYVMHVDRYWRDVGVTWADPGRRPDLIGYGQLGWVVLEAKGRTRGVQGDVVNRAVEQKHGIATIGGQAPGIRVAAIAHFTPRTLALRVRDPSPVSSEELEGDPATFVREYYAPLVPALVSSPIGMLLGRRVRVTNLPGMDMRIGVETEVLERLERSDASVKGLADEWSREARDRDASGELTSVGADGIAVELGPSWTEQSFEREAWERTRPESEA